MTKATEQSGKTSQRSSRSQRPPTAAAAKRSRGRQTPQNAEAAFQALDDRQAPVISIHRITPAIAQDLLARRLPSRPIQRAAVDHLAGELKAGNFHFNANPILVNRDGQVIDGVQRLAAAVQAGIGFWSVLVQNVSEDVLHTVDQQRRRSYAGVLEARGERNASTLLHMMLKLARHDLGALGKQGFSIGWGRLDHILNENPGLRDAAKYASESLARLLPVGVRAPLAFMGRQANPQALDRFFDAIARPEQYAPDEPGVLIRQRLTVERSRGGRVDMIEMWAVCIMALGDTAAERRGGVYRWSRTGKKPFPTLPGYIGLAGLLDEPEEIRTELVRHDDVDDAILIAGGADVQSVDLRVEHIDRQQAIAYLQHNNTRNRRIVHGHVDTIARDIRSDRWMQSFQPICFDKDGRLLNGQHRLTAVVRADRPIEVLVARNLDSEAFLTYDRHAKKAPRLDDLVDTPGDRNVIQAAAHLLWMRDLKPADARQAKPSAGELRAVIEAHPLLVQQRLYGRAMSFLGRVSAIMYAAYKVLSEDPVLGEEFLGKLKTGENLTRGDAALEARTKLMKSVAARKADRSAGKRTVEGDETIRLILEGWEKHKRQSKRERQQTLAV